MCPLHSIAEDGTGLRVFSMFNQQELQMLLSGVNSPIDMEDLRQHTQYGGVYNDGDPTIQAFWKVWPSYSYVIVVHTDFLTGAGWLQPGTGAGIFAICDKLQPTSPLASILLAVVGQS